MIKAHKVWHGLTINTKGGPMIKTHVRCGMAFCLQLDLNDLINTGLINTKEVSYPLVSVRGIQVGCNFLTGNPQQWCLADGNLQYAYNHEVKIYDSPIFPLQPQRQTFESTTVIPQL